MIPIPAAAAVLAAISAASAPAAAPPATSTDPIVGGPVIPGVCFLSPNVVLTQSKAGQAASQRLQQFAQEAQNQLQPERSAAETEAKTLETESRSLSPAQLQTRRDALSARIKTLQERVNEQSRQLEYTRVKVIQRISQTAQPIISATYASHHCGLLLQRDGVLGGNLANDLTAEVLRELDAKMTSITFNLESPPAAVARPTA